MGRYKNIIILKITKTRLESKIFIYRERRIYRGGHWFKKSHISIFAIFVGRLSLYGDVCIAPPTHLFLFCFVCLFTYDTVIHINHLFAWFIMYKKKATYHFESGFFIYFYACCHGVPMVIS